MFTNQFINPISYNRSKISVARLILQETGTYNQMYSRPYTANVNDTNVLNVINRVEHNNGMNLGAGTFSGLASRILVPKATVTTADGVVIPNGWQERRLRFVLEVEIEVNTGGKIAYFFQGFTSYCGIILASGSIDPNMVFYINSYIRVNRSPQMTAMGGQIRDVVTESVQIVNGQLVYNGHSPVYKIRPSDVLSSIQQDYLNNSGMGTVFDSRSVGSTDNFTSNRKNNVPSDYFGSLVKSWTTGHSLTDWGSGSEDAVGRAQMYAVEPYVNENAFLRALSSLQGVINSTSFTMNDIVRLDPSALSRVHCQALAPSAMSQVHQTGQTAYWNAANRETVFASQLSTAIPSLMMEHFISSFTFITTNKVLPGQQQTTPLGCMSLTNADMSHFTNNLITRIEREVMYDLSFGNEDLYWVEMSVDLFGETKISVSLNDGPIVPFTVPSFSDSLLAPIYTSNYNHYQAFSHDLESVLNAVNQVNNRSIQTMSYNNII